MNAPVINRPRHQVCSVCDVELPLNDFYFDAGFGPFEICSPCYARICALEAIDPQGVEAVRMRERIAENTLRAHACTRTLQ